MCSFIGFFCEEKYKKIEEELNYNFKELTKSLLHFLITPLNSRKMQCCFTGNRNCSVIFAKICTSKVFNRNS